VARTGHTPNHEMLLGDLISVPGTRFPWAVREASSACACGVYPRHAFPAGVSYLTSNQICFEIR